MTHNLKDLSDKRDALLLVEVAMWLHMLGKFHECFLNGNHELAKKIPPDLKQRFDKLDNLLKDQSWSGLIWDQFGIPQFKATSLSFSHFIEKHHTPGVSQGLLKLVWDAHGRGSGIEKGVFSRFGDSQEGIVYLSTAFGTEKNAIDLNHLHIKRHCFHDFLQTNIELLKQSLANSKYHWIRNNFISEIEQYFRQTVAETRRPLSDVSLFDQTFASVAFLKAALAQNLINGWKKPDAKDISDKYHWRLLKIGLDGLAFWGDAVRIGDLLARQQLVSDSLDEVQTVIEHDYPLGLQVYRDENGSVFIVPDVDNLLDAKVKSGGSLRQHLQEIVHCRSNGEACWMLEMSDRTRNTLRFGKLATTPLSKTTAHPYWIAPYWNEKQDICPVCSLRPVSHEKLKICNVCKERRTARAKEWTEKLSTTIWIDEVADTNGRLALLVGQFELESWLTGEAFNSIISFDPITRRMHNRKSKNEEPKEFDFDYNQLIKDVKGRVFTKDSNLENLVESLQTGGSFDEFYKMQVTDTDLGEGRTVEDPSILALAMMRQNPSFARLRRVWETTQRFWQEALADVPDAQLPKVKGRLIIESSNLTQFRLQRCGNYDLVLGKTKLSALHDNGKLITTDNLRYTAKQLGAKYEEYASDEAAVEFVRNQLLNQQLPIEEPTGYGSPNKLQGKLNISKVTFNATEYSPVIPILAEPRTFMALVPADKSLEVVKAIQTKYECEMGKVRNRLPLHLGVVYFQRRTPLRSTLDAGRQMLSYKVPNDKQQWQVLNIQCLIEPEKKDQFSKAIILELLQDDQTITWRIPVAMGDGTTDVWYPYVFLETGGDDSKVNGRLRTIKSQRPGTSNPCWLVHAADLREGDRIYFTPSTFDFEFLDSTARRFEIYYDENGRRPRRTRPFHLEDLDRFDTLWKILKNLETSQCHQVIYAIEATREMWFQQNESGLLLNDEGKPPEEDKVFRRFVADTLANATWTKEKTDWWQSLKDWRRKLNEVCEISLNTWVQGELTVAKQLIDAGVRGELADLAELHMEILKEREVNSNGNL